MPLEASLFRPSCGFINHNLQRRTGLGTGQTMWCLPEKQLAPAPENKALIKLHTVTPQHISTAGFHTGQSGGMGYGGRGKRRECIDFWRK